MFPKYFFKVILFFLIISLILFLLSVAFYTLMERKIMGINQFRIGPNKIMLLGFLQPVFDGFKLFLKMINNPIKNPFIFYWSPLLAFSISTIFWGLFFSLSSIFKNLFILFILGVSVYSFVISGWSSFSKFSYLGGIRASSQTISYEISLAIIIMMIIYVLNNMSFNIFKEMMNFILFPIFICWILSLVAETNRAPFDFSEGESELISGFNIEYGSSGFVLFFLSEYLMMIFFSFFSCFMFSLNYFMFFVLLFTFISFRTSFPRFRYDFLQEFMWFKILPMICCLMLIIILLI